jgi:hypothetical protein
MEECEDAIYLIVPCSDLVAINRGKKEPAQKSLLLL